MLRGRSTPLIIHHARGVYSTGDCVSHQLPSSPHRAAAAAEAGTILTHRKGREVTIRGKLASSTLELAFNVAAGLMSV